jgi:hypothetical protein
VDHPASRRGSLPFDDLAAPPKPWAKLTSCVISANAPSMSRLLNAEYACSIRGLESAIHAPTILAMRSVLVIRPVHIIADELQQTKGEGGGGLQNRGCPLGVLIG